MNDHRRPVGWLPIALLSTVVAVQPVASWAQAPRPAVPGNAAPADESATPTPAAAKPAEQPAAAVLVNRQQQVAAQFEEFEKKLLRIAELTGSTDPRRAALLRKVVTEAKQREIDVQLQTLIDSLRDDRLANAVTAQSALEQDLARLLELMLSEQRSDRLKEEQQKIKEQIRKIRELIQKESQLQGRTASASDAELRDVAEAQGKLADETARLNDQMRGSKPGDKPSSGAEKKPSQDKSDENGKNDQDKSPGKSGDSQEKDGGEGQKPKEGDPSKRPGDEKKPGESGKSAEPSDGNSPSSESGEMAEGSGQGKAQQRVAAAQKKMEQARKRLEEAKRDGAQADQEEAIRQLEQAKAELEEILRQAREEEVQRVLAELEARFRRMHELQLEVREGTKRLVQIAPNRRSRNDEIEAGRLGRRESQIETEAERTLVLLREEGSAVAMVEAVEQLRDDIHQVVVRLSQAKADERTLGLEEEILAALEELIASVKKAQRDAENRRAQGAGGAMSPDAPLVDKLSELKVIRSLQFRVNQRTKRYTEMLKDEIGQADEPELLEQLRELSAREARIYEATRDLVTGKNQ